MSIRCPDSGIQVGSVLPKGPIYWLGLASDANFICAVATIFDFWLVGCFGFNGPLRQYFSLYRAVSQREGERGEKRIDESKNVQTTPTRTYYKRSRPLPYCNPNCRTPRHWKFTQHHRTTRPPLWYLMLQFSVEKNKKHTHLNLPIDY